MSKVLGTVRKYQEPKKNILETKITAFWGLIYYGPLIQENKLTKNIRDLSSIHLLSLKLCFINLFYFSDRNKGRWHGLLGIPEWFRDLTEM
jgi:hypothetical protein